jgi:3'-phosphoadenosine 5'-phosphosulfate sulfotransferase (PAPS reductase)/FAD synthetase
MPVAISEPHPAGAPAPAQHDLAAFAEQLAKAGPRQIVEAAASAMSGRLAVVSSFGTESAVLLKFVADVDPTLPVLFLDTLWLFKETLAYREALIARLGLTDVRTITPSPSALALEDPSAICAFAIATPAAESARSRRWPTSSWHSTAGSAAASAITAAAAPLFSWWKPMGRG